MGGIFHLGFPAPSQVVCTSRLSTAGRSHSQHSTLSSNALFEVCMQAKGALLSSSDPCDCTDLLVSRGHTTEMPTDRRVSGTLTARGLCDFFTSICSEVRFPAELAPAAAAAEGEARVPAKEPGVLGALGLCSWSSGWSQRFLGTANARPLLAKRRTFCRAKNFTSIPLLANSILICFQLWKRSLG